MTTLARLGALVPLLMIHPAAAAAPELPQDDRGRLEVLFFGAPTENGPGHDPITRYRALKKGLGVEGINLSYLEDPAEVLRADTLDGFDALLMYGNWNQDSPMPAAQLEALGDYVNGGGGFVPVHCASACYGGSPEFIQLVGARFSHHGGEEFEVRNVMPDHPILQGLDGYKAWDETYVHDRHADDREILQTRDGEPWTWTRNQGEGRVFYTAGGHDHRVWDLPEFQQLIRNGIYWAVGPDRRQRLENLDLPELAREDVSMPGYRQRSEITRAQVPLAPEQSMKLAQVPVGMTLSLFASEPDIVNPICINWDERGRAYVIETIDYPNNLQADNLGHDRITICEDSDGDGKADKFTRFAGNLSVPTSLVFANGGVVCTNGSDMLFLEDTDGDDRADVRRVLFSGFGMGDTHAGVSNLRYGLDGWIYATVGYSGFQGVVGGEEFGFAQAVFRFRPDGSKLEVIQGTTNNTWGLGFTEEFDMLGSTANGNPSFYVTFPRGTYEAVDLGQPRTPRADDNPYFNPMSQDIRQVDQFDRYTAAAGHAVYTSRRFPEAYHNRMAFICGPTGKLVGNFSLSRRGAGWKAEQSPNNLYASADAWSAPVCAEVGPDGAVWICDWYNLIIQHNPTPNIRSAGVDARNGKGNAYMTPLRDKEHGRIYRVYPKGSAEDADPGLDPGKRGTLVAALDHPSLFWRTHAQRLIMEKADSELVPELVARIGEPGPAALHAFHALAALGSAAPELVQAALESEDPAIRRTAIAMADPSQLKQAFVRDGTIRAQGRELAELLVGLAAGASDPEIGTAIYRLGAGQAATIFEDDTLSDAWQIAARSQADSVLAAAESEVDIEIDKSEPVNLIPNGDISEVANGQAAGWTDLRNYSGAKPDAITLGVSPEGRNGTPCLRIHCDEVTDSALYMSVPVRPRTRYRLSAWIRTDGLKPVPDAPGALLIVQGNLRTGNVSGTTDWTEVSVEFESGRQDRTDVQLLFGGYGGGSGTAYYDDISLIMLGNRNSFEGAIAALESFATEDGTEPTGEIVRSHEPDPEIHARGEAVYGQTCIACHGVDGKGVPEAFPPLDGSDWLVGDPDLPIKVVLHGLSGPVSVGDQTFDSVMAPLGPALDDRQIADVLTYVRQRWTNDAAPVTAGQVGKVRSETTDRTTMWTADELGR